MSKTDEEIVREALLFPIKHNLVGCKQFAEALIAFDSLTKRTVPELPPGWIWHRIGQLVTKGKGVYRAHASKIEERERPYDKRAMVRVAVAKGEGGTIRMACESALEQIERDKT